MLPVSSGATAAEAFVKFSSVLLVGFVSLSAVSFAEQSETEKHPWLVRIRALDMVPSNQSDAFASLGLTFPSNSIHLSTKVFPEIDFTYFFTKNLAAELVLTYPQQHDATLAGVGSIGTATHLPPTLTAQYHFPMEKCPVTPYVGAGVNYTIITSSNLSAAGTSLDLTKTSFGLAYGGGLDYKLGGRWSLNFDYKHVYIKTNVKAGGATLSTAKIDPNLYSIGIGYRF